MKQEVTCDSCGSFCMCLMKSDFLANLNLRLRVNLSPSLNPETLPPQPVWGASSEAPALPEVSAENTKHAGEEEGVRGCDQAQNCWVADAAATYHRIIQSRGTRSILRVCVGSEVTLIKGSWFEALVTAVTWHCLGFDPFRTGGNDSSPHDSRKTLTCAKPTDERNVAALTQHFTTRLI